MCFVVVDAESIPFFAGGLFLGALAHFFGSDDAVSCADAYGGACEWCVGGEGGWSCDADWFDGREGGAE